MQLELLPDRVFLRCGRVQLVGDATVDARHRVVTKYRWKEPTPPAGCRSRRSPNVRCNDRESRLEVNGEADHVDLLISLPPSLDCVGIVNKKRTTAASGFARNSPTG